MRHGGTVYIYSMFGDEVIVPMYDLHFRSLHVRGFCSARPRCRCPFCMLTCHALPGLVQVRFWT